MGHASRPRAGSQETGRLLELDHWRRASKLLCRFETRENARRARTCVMWRIRERVAAGAAVNKMGASSWGRNVLAPHLGLEPPTFGLS